MRDSMEFTGELVGHNMESDLSVKAARRRLEEQSGTGTGKPN